jgi:hypothetical protein
VPPRAVLPAKRGTGARTHDLLREHYVLEAVPWIGQRELDRVLPDAGWGQGFFFFGLCARARILYSRTRSCRS